MRWHNLAKNKPMLAILVLVLAALACGEYVTPVPTETDAPAPLVVDIPTQQLPTDTAIPKPVPTHSAEWTTTVKLPTVNVRAEPNGKVIGSLTVGTTVTVKQCVDNWCQIADPAGWIFEGCLDVDSDLGCAAK